MKAVPENTTLDRFELADELEKALHDLLHTWFPRCVDDRHGGFLTDFDYQWRPQGPQAKGIEFQGRMTGLAAHVALAYPAVPLYREMADHGFHYLSGAMWDEAHGGWYRLVDREGRPQEHATKHTHGSAYALGASAAHHRLTSSPQSLELAKRAYAWIDAFAHDDEHGGYYGALLRDGRWIRSAAENPVSDSHRDVIGTPFGYKDVNTASDCLRAASELFGVWPDEALRVRLHESFALVRDRFVTRGGAVHMYVTLDFSPMPDFSRYPQSLQSANHLRAAAEALSQSTDARTSAVIKSIADLVLAYGWDTTNGGFYFGGSTFGPTYVGDYEVFIRHKAWWAQAEGLKALVAMALEYPGDDRRYDAKVLTLWRYIQRHLIDTGHGGWLASGTDVTPTASRGPKASMWRDASHEGMALLECVAALRA
jgi:mannobiose 2-epimerase